MIKKNLLSRAENIIVRFLNVKNSLTWLQIRRNNEGSSWRLLIFFNSPYQHINLMLVRDSCPLGDFIRQVFDILLWRHMEKDLPL